MYSTCAVSNLGGYSLNTGSTASPFTFPEGTLEEGHFLYVSADNAVFEKYFGVAPDYVHSAFASDFDSNVHLFYEGKSIDHIDAVDTGVWLYRKSGTHSTAIFDSRAWTFGAAEKKETTGAGAAPSASFPMGTFDQPAVDSAVDAPSARA